ncbi:MAG: TIGR03668 family PPOX class F420-dependent oxidoreductase [Herpetosiphonaceae bacterium]|nr:TIGR03668 family PPOX class F420-dependent oxidoreductase [Herpetosiphonaceae bacterium]
MPTLSSEHFSFVDAMRVGRLATVDATEQPHVIPVCYACDGSSFYIALDDKPKHVAPERLKRVRNILEHPQVALVIDRYSDDWSALAYLLIRGTAVLVAPDGAEHSGAIGLLRGRYSQYQAMPIEERPVIAIRPTSLVSWGLLSQS